MQVILARGALAKLELKKLEEQDKARKAKEEAERKVAQEQQRREADEYSGST